MRSKSLALGRAAAVLCALLGAEPLAHADAPALSPPKLARFVEATDPRPPGADRGAVELELDVDREGAVSAARVTRSGGDALDAAALEAARRFVFEPATRDGEPVAARIRYEYVFEAHAAPPPAPAVPRPASMAGVVLDAATGAPLAGAAIVLTTGAGEPTRAVADARGRFRFDGIAPGRVRVVVTADGHAESRLDETLEPGTLTEVTLRLDEPRDPESFGATARVDAPAREVTRRPLEREEMTRVAGTRGDPLRAVELLPGVSRPAAVGDGLPILRGANPQDSQVFLEGAPVPILYHLGGLTSFVHARSLESIDLYPSNFSVRYGRKVGGVIDVRLRDPRTDRLHGIADLNLIDSSLLVESPLGERVAVLAAARRSNLDAVLNSAASTADLAVTAAPVYWDYQAVAAYRPTERDRLRLLAYGSSDRLALVLKKPSDDDPALRGAFDQHTVFHRVQAGYRHRWAGGSEASAELTYGRLDSLGAFGALGRSEFVVDTLQGRSEVAAVLSPAARVVAGVDLLGNHFSGGYRGIPPTTGEGESPTTLSNQREVAVTASTWILQPAAYVEAGLRPVPRLLVVPGVRADYSDLIDRASVDPRLSTRWEVTDETALKAGVGRFSQAPAEQYAVSPIGNPRLRMTKALHVSAGVEQALGRVVSASAEGFAKWLDDVIAGTPDGRAPFFENTQDGRIFGGELLLRVKPTGRFFGFVSYTLMRSERRDAGQAWRLFDRDQPHILGASAVYRLGRGWELGGSFRMTSGTPYTPVVASTYDATTDVYLPRAGAAMSARNPAFTRLDLRVEKKWTFTMWSLAAYLDVQNVLNAPNREGFRYTYDYGRREGARGLPVFPSLGIRGEL